jgi:glycosyltransferase involved in cell wall biosynthesis
MPSRCTLLDITRLSKGLYRRTPTGIDRVDLAYARHFLSSPQNHALVMFPGGPRFLDSEAASLLLKAVARRWGEDADAGLAPSADIQNVSRPISFSETGKKLRRYTGLAAGELRRLRHLMRSTGRAPKSVQDSVYLHTSHSGFERAERIEALCGRWNVQPVVFLHDLIPIRFPEYATPQAAEKHKRRLQTLARRAQLVIVNSQAVADDLHDYFTASGWEVPPVLVNPLGVEPDFFRAGGRRPPVDEGYFVMCGTIEPRKNHLLILHIWRQLQQSGREPPRLIIIGRRGWENENIVDLLERCPAVHDHVTEISDMKTPDLARLMAGARAVLMPSFAEGYGLPIVEALAVGTPVIASNIRAHREIAGGLARLIDPLDGAAWREAILDLAAASQDQLNAWRQQLSGFSIPTWKDHLQRTQAALEVL